MSTSIASASPPPTVVPLPNLIALVREHWFVIGALLLVVIPSLVNLARETWSTEAGAHGPIVLATGLWLLHHSAAELVAKRSQPPSALVLGLCLVPIVVIYALGRAVDLLLVEVAMALALSFLLLASRIGFRPLWSQPFPFIYLAMLTPVPGWVLDASTMWLQHAISTAAASFLSMLDYPVAREGVVIYVAQYQLLVEDACSGMNSLFGLIAISLFYIYLLHRADWRHATLLIIGILPIAVFVNLIRVVLLILITYHFGDAVAQGFIHNFAGIVLFGLSLSLMVLVDLAIRHFRNRRSPA